MAVGRSGKCAKVLLILFNLLFWISGLCLLVFGVWMLVDPRRNYLLDLVQLSEGDPLLLVSAYLFIITGCISILIGFLGCCGTIREIRCLLVTFMIFLLFLLLIEVASAVLAIMFRNQFTESYMQSYLYNITRHKYGRDGWATELMDTVQYYIKDSLHSELKRLIREEYGGESVEKRSITRLVDKIQFYQSCCGSGEASDWDSSWWQSRRDISRGMLVPPSCCIQTLGASAMHPIPSSLAKCQLPHDQGQYRYNVHKCCGSSGPKDYDLSWWQINESLGTPSFVPQSCCYQSLDARPWNLKPIDDRCTFYEYFTKTANATVWTEGCHSMLLEWFGVHTTLFAAFGLGIAGFQLIGIILSACLCSKVGYEIGY